MYVCLCKGVTDKQIQRAVDQGARTMRDLRQEFGVGSQCGKCTCCARDVMHDAIHARKEIVHIHVPSPQGQLDVDIAYS